ncbi:MAG: hypothetical protein Q9187_000975 [Circinaria calcarea]
MEAGITDEMEEAMVLFVAAVEELGVEETDVEEIEVEEMEVVVVDAVKLMAVDGTSRGVDEEFIVIDPLPEEPNVGNESDTGPKVRELVEAGISLVIDVLRLVDWGVASDVIEKDIEVGTVLLFSAFNVNSLEYVGIVVDEDVDGGLDVIGVNVVDKDAALDAAMEISAVMSGIVVVGSRLLVPKRDSDVKKAPDEASEVKLGTTKVDEDSANAVD